MKSFPSFLFFITFLFFCILGKGQILWSQEKKIQIQPKYTLRQKKRYAYLLTDKFVFPKKESGKVRFSMVVRFLLVYYLEPVKISSQQVEFELTFARIFLYRWQGGMYLKYDTKNPSSKEAGSINYILHLLLHPMIGKKIRILTDLYRQKVKVEGSKELYQKALQSIPPAYRGFLKNILTKLFSQKALESFFLTCHPPLPKTPVVKGDSWEVVRSVPRLGADETLRFTFKEIQKKKTHVYYIFSLFSTLKPSKDAVGAGGYRFIQGNSSGYVILDENGQAFQSNSLSTLKVILPSSDSHLTGHEEIKAYIVRKSKKKKKRGKDNKDSRNAGK